MKIPDLPRLIRNPNGGAEKIQAGSPLMPLSLAVLCHDRVPPHEGAVSGG